MTMIVWSVFEKRLSTKIFRWSFVWIVKMLQYKRIDITEGIDVSRKSSSKECMLCHYWYLRNVGFRFEPHVCNKCHDVLMTAYKLKDIAILNVKEVDFRCILWIIGRDETVNRLNNSMSEQRSLVKWN